MKSSHFLSQLKIKYLTNDFNSLIKKESGSTMAPGLILGIFLSKRKTRVFPYISWVCELFSTALFILLATATWT